MVALLAATSGWDFQVGIELANPIFYLNAVSVVFAIILFVKLRDVRDINPLADAVWWAAIVLVVGAGLHFLGDLTNFPEDWDHVLIHATVATALLTLVVKASRAE